MTIEKTMTPRDVKLVAPRNLTPDLEASASDVAWIDENTLLLAVTEGCRSKLVRVDAAGGKPEELADLVTFLASEKNGYVTGTTILVDGGVVRSVM